MTFRFGALLGTTISVPLSLAIKVLDLRPGQLGMTGQIPSVCRFDFGIRTGFHGRDQVVNTHSDARIITWSEIQFSNMATLFHGKYLVEINISIVVHSDPLEFHVGDTDRTSPTVLVVI